MHAQDILADLKKSKIYGSLAEETLLRVSEDVAGRYAKQADAVKAAKNALHQAYGMYAQQVNYASLLKKVQQWDGQDAKTFCEPILQMHASTRERFSQIEEFYRFALEDCRAASVLDVGCGLHPFALPWMNLAQGVSYYATDISQTGVSAINAFMEKCGMQPCGYALDILCRVPQERVDVAFLLKILPVLEMQKKGAAARVLSEIHADRVIVSFPLKSMSGKGTLDQYRERYEEKIYQHFSKVQEAEIGSEWVLRCCR